MKKIIKSGLWTLGLVIILSLSGCGASKTPVQTELSTVNPATAASPAEALFKQSCVSCHGVNLEGRVGPNLQKVGSRLTQDQLFSKIQTGGGGMPAFKARLETTEIKALAEWLALKK